jgi:long-chain acyl-CoA synthetase
MTTIDDFLARLGEHSQREAMIWGGRGYSFGELQALITADQVAFAAAGLGEGSTVAIDGDFSPASVAALLAVLGIRGVAVPLTASVQRQAAEFCETAAVQWTIAIDADDRMSLRAAPQRAAPALIARLRAAGHPGLVLFTSGSAGQSKAVVHDADLLLTKYLRPRHCFRTLAFLLFDHIGGLDTLFYNLANGSCLVTAPSRLPDAVCAAIESHRVEVLPVSPSFINILLLSGAHERHDLSSLQIITYGAEVMPESTLARLCEALPHVRVLQKFGTTEIGTMRSHSLSSDSVWVKIGGEGYQTRVVDGMLEIKAESAMLGYLNAPSPFTVDGWFVTGDRVEVDGDYYRILGRQSDMINVGGQKVDPAEIESALIELDNVRDVVVYGKRSAILGQTIVARFELVNSEDVPSLRRRMRQHCQGRLAAHKIPNEIEIVQGPLYGTRMKKRRNSLQA